MTLADTATPDGDPSGDQRPHESVPLPGASAPALPAGVDDQIDVGRRTAVREAQFRSVTVEVSVWIGKTRRTFGDLAKLRPGDVIELDRAVGAPVDIVLNREVVIARGEVVDVGDEYGVRITEIVSDEDGYSVLILEFGRMHLVLGLVLGLLWLFSKFGRGRQGKGLGRGRWMAGADAGKIEVMDRRALGRHSSIAVVRAAGRIVVVGQTPQQISVLLDASADLGVPGGESAGGSHEAAVLDGPQGPDEDMLLPGLAGTNGADAPKAWDAFLERLREMTVRR